MAAVSAYTPSSFIEGTMSPHIRNKLRSCKAQSLKDVFSQGILEDQKQKLRALDFETPRADSIAHCEVNAIRSLSCYRCGSTSHLVRECPMPAEPPQAPANNRVKQHANDFSTSRNSGNNGNIQDALTSMTQALQALKNKNRQNEYNNTKVIPHKQLQQIIWSQQAT